MHLHHTHEEEHALAVVNSLQITITNTIGSWYVSLQGVVNSLQITCTYTARMTGTMQCIVVNGLQITIINTP